MTGAHPITILLADDDADDRMLALEALSESRLVNDVRIGEDGEQLMDYLNRRGPYADPGVSPRPGLILLDLNMPRKDGREALLEIKSEPAFRHIPIVILSTSKEDRDIAFSIKAGAASFITKPATFDEWIEIMKSLTERWLAS